jgi:hypothetical protein
LCAEQAKFLGDQLQLAIYLFVASCTTGRFHCKGRLGTITITAKTKEEEEEEEEWW